MLLFKNTQSSLIPLIDFIKYELKDVRPEILAANSLLEFETKVNQRTGELGVYSHAFYKGLEFKIFEPTRANPEGRITIEGSLHKYWNNGGHNFNDFALIHIYAVLEDLKVKFQITPKNCFIKQIEIGVNILPPYPTKTVLNCCILHKTERFKWTYTNDEGNYIQVQHGNYYVKIYDKQKHYQNKGFNVPNPVMRFEIKYKRTQLCTALKKRNTAKITIQDVLNFGINNFKTLLLKEWENVLFYDFTVLNSTKFQDKYSNPNYWAQLKYSNLKWHRNNLNNLIKQDPENLKEEIGKTIAKKVDFLNNQTTQIKPLNIVLKTVVEVSNNEDRNRRICSITGLNISMQKNDSVLLSHTGLNYYYKTDRKVFNELKRKYLSDRWRHQKYKVQIKEIAHNIRNTMSNQRRKQKKLYPDYQPALFQL